MKLETLHDLSNHLQYVYIANSSLTNCEMKSAKWINSSSCRPRLFTDPRFQNLMWQDVAIASTFNIQNVAIASSLNKLFRELFMS